MNSRIKTVKMADDQDRISSGDELDEVDSSANVETDRFSSFERHLKSLDYFLANGLRQVFARLDAKDKGALAKTQLQVICANICSLLNLKYVAEELHEFLDPKTELSFDELLQYVNKELLPKVSGEKIDIEKFERISWTIVEKGRTLNSTKILSDDELFALWQAYNKINVHGAITIDVEEAAILLQNFMQAIGTPWTKGPFDDYTEKLELTFWELVDCLESKYIKSTPASVYREGLESINNMYVREVQKAGLLTKKGHRIKSMKERWFVLTTRMLSYFESKNIKKKKGIIMINKLSTVESVTDTKSLKCRFTVSCGNKSTPYEMEAKDQKTKNEWITAILKCIDLNENQTPLFLELEERAKEREQRRQKQAEEERQRLMQEELIRKQLEELELIRQARDQAQAQAESEAALLEKERKRREELEALKAEYEKLLEEEKKAREAESLVRTKQEQFLEEEMAKRMELEAIKVEQDRILEEERKAREGLEEISKEQAKALEEERERLKILDEARVAAEAEVAAAHAKLEEAEQERRAAAAKVEAAKEKTRRMRLPVGLAKPLELQQKGITTHRGMGAFVEDDFTKTPLYLSGEDRPVAVNQRDVPDEQERAQIVEVNLVKPSQGRATFEGSNETNKTEEPALNGNVNTLEQENVES